MLIIIIIKYNLILVNLQVVIFVLIFLSMWNFLKYMKISIRFYCDKRKHSMSVVMLSACFQRK